MTKSFNTFLTKDYKPKTLKRLDKSYVVFYKPITQRKLIWKVSSDIISWINVKAESLFLPKCCGLEMCALLWAYTDAEEEVSDIKFKFHVVDVHITQGLRAFNKSPGFTYLYPNMASLWSKHHLWSERPPDVNMSATEGQDWASPAAAGAVCSGQTDVLSLQGVQDAAELSVAPACILWRWRGGAKFHRSTDGQQKKPDCKLLTSAAPGLNCPYHGLTVSEAVPKRPDCLRFTVNKCQSQQARLQWHMLVLSLFHEQTQTTNIDCFSLLTPDVSFICTLKYKFIIQVFIPLTTSLLLWTCFSSLKHVSNTGKPENDGFKTMWTFDCLVTHCS